MVMYIHVFVCIFSAAKLTTDKDVDFQTTSKDKIIIDKTRFIPKLLNVERQPQFIILRPYRFGKSFFLTTLAAFFEGKKDLFCNQLGKQMDICNSKIYDWVNGNLMEWNWVEYPILYLDFGLVAGSLTDYVKTEVLTLARKNKIFDIDKEATFGSVMECAFKSIQQKTGKNIVILVDEYDTFVMAKYFDNPASAERREDEIRCFFHVVKNNANLIRFAFVIGATKITTTAVGRKNKRQLRKMCFLVSHTFILTCCKLYLRVVLSQGHIFIKCISTSIR